MLLLSYSFCDVIYVNFRSLRVLNSFHGFLLRDFNVLIGLLDKLHHRLLLQSDRLLKIREELVVLLFFLDFGLLLLDYTCRHLLDMAVVIIESGLQSAHLVRDQAETVLELPLHQFHMRLHHICQEL